MSTVIINTQPNISKLRPNLWQAPDGAVIPLRVLPGVVGFGAILSPTGLYFCFTCNGPDAPSGASEGTPHTQTVEADWLAGRDSAEEWADDYGLQEATI